MFCEVWLFLTCQLMKSAVLTVGPPFAAEPVVWMSVVNVGAAITVVVTPTLTAIPPDISLTNSGPSSVNSGANATYTITVNNTTTTRLQQ
jgi:hypothetical protein